MNKYFCIVALLLLHQPVYANPIARFAFFPGTWYADTEGVPTSITVKRFSRATIGDRDCTWGSAAFRNYSDAIKIECPGMQPIYAGLRFENEELKGKYLEAYISVSGGQIGVRYYPSIEARNAVLNSSRVPLNRPGFRGGHLV